MSKYTNYDKVSESYDSGRIADGVETMTIMLSGMLKKDLSQIHMLEAGCGTGNYSQGFLENGVGKLTMIDASQGMLDRATEKVNDFKEHVVEIKQHILPTLPFPDETFDVVTFLQVLHHLDSYHLEEGEGKEAKGKYPNVLKAFEEARRVLKPGGVLLVDHSFQQNLEAFPWISLAPKALALLQKACVHDEILLELVKDANFKNLRYVGYPNGSYYKREIQENLGGVLDPKWRSWDSGWQFVERSGELPSLLEKVQRKKDEGKLEAFWNEMNRKHRFVGLHTSVFAQKL